jgi:hypothetical protein
MPAILPFNERKAIEAAAYISSLLKEGIQYKRLVLLLYLADRRTLIIFGRPITTASYIATEKGIELNNRIPVIEFKGMGNEAHLVQLDKEFIWEVAFTGLDREEALVGSMELSGAEGMILEEIVAEYGSLSFVELFSLVQKLPEMQKSGPIYYRDILKAAGKPEDAIAVIEEEMNHITYMDAIWKRLKKRQKALCGRNEDDASRNLLN